jgi:hypothetical protein
MGLSALILEPDQNSRTRFKEITTNNPSFSKCMSSSTLLEAQERVRRGLKFDAIYISTRFDPIVVSQFISTNRKIMVEKAANLIVVAREEQSNITRQFEIGKPDGYLLEPLVPRDLDGSVDFIKKFKALNGGNVMENVEQEIKPVGPPRVNIKALCARMAVAIDRGKPGLKDLRELSKRVELLSDEQKLEYYEELVKYMINFKKPQTNPNSASGLNNT